MNKGFLLVKEAGVFIRQLPENWFRVRGTNS